MPRPLENLRHELFAQNIAKQMTQRTAYMIAGFSPGLPDTIDANAARLANMPEIKRRVREIIQPIVSKGRLNPERLVEEFSRLAYANMSDYLDDDGNLDYKATTRAQRAAIGKLTRKSTKHGEDVTFELTGKLEAMKALAQFMKLLGADQPSFNVSVNVVQQLKLEDREALLQAVAAMLPAKKE